jgi:uncharacterized protein
MSERQNYEPGVPCWVETLQPDVEAATRFYGELLSWEFAGPGPMPDEPGQYFVARLRSRDVAGVGSAPTNGAAPLPAWNTYISVASADDAAARALSAGGAVITAPFDALPAGRMAVLADPAGAVFCVWEPKQRDGAQLVNEPSAWAMSTLHAPDPQAAAAFYAAVFGWGAEPLSMGGQTITLFRLPGYVGGEPAQPVPRDVVAVMLATNNDGPPPHWSVDFWIDDADAAAATAASLGGSVVVPPHHTPGFRNAVLADPHGAVFSVSQLLVGP